MTLFQLFKEIFSTDQRLNLLTLLFEAVGDVFKSVIVPVLLGFEIRQIYKFTQILSR